MKYRITPIGFSLILILIIVVTIILAAFTSQPPTELIKNIELFDHAFQGDFSLITQGDIINLKPKKINFTFNFNHSLMIQSQGNEILFSKDQLMFNNEYLKYFDLYLINKKWLNLDETIEVIDNNPLPKGLISDYNMAISRTIEPYFNDQTLILDINNFCHLLSKLNNIFKSNSLYDQWLLTYVKHYFESYDASVHDQARRLKAWHMDSSDSLDQLIMELNLKLNTLYTDQSLITIEYKDVLSITGILYYKHCDASEQFHLRIRPSNTMNTVPDNLSEMTEENLSKLIALLDF